MGSMWEDNKLTRKTRSNWESSTSMDKHSGHFAALKRLLSVRHILIDAWRILFTVARIIYAVNTHSACVCRVKVNNCILSLCQ